MNSLSSLFFKVDLDESIEKIDNGLNFLNPTPLDLVAFYKILLVFDKQKLLNEPYFSDLEKRKGALKDVNKAINIYFSTYNSDKFLKDVESFDEKNLHNTLDFLELICRKSIYKKLDDKGIDCLLNRIPMHTILKDKNFVFYCEDKIKQIFLTHSECIEFIVSKYDLKDGGNYFIPKLNDEEINEMIINYLSYEYSHYKYLKALKLHRDSKDSYILKRKVRIAIDNKIEEWMSKPKENMVSTSREFGIVFDEKQKEPIRFIDNGQQQIVSISIDYFIADLSEEGVLSRVRNLCGFMDEQGRIRMVYNPNKEPTISLVFSSKNKDEYGSDTFFYLDLINTLMVKSLYGNYEHREIHLEKIIDWVINVQFKERYGINGFKSNLYLLGDYQVKCEHIFNELSSFINQFRIYAEEGELTPELINVTKDSFKLGDIPSLNNNKYAELNDNSDLNNIFFLMFSDQSPLTYISEKYKADTFIHLIAKFRIKKSEFLEFQQKHIDTLIQFKIIKCDAFVEVDNVKLFALLKDLYDNRFVTYSCLTSDYKNIIDDLIKKGWLRYSNKLFSCSESDYLDYYLNNSKFSNALALRNKYEHGSTSHFTNDQNQDNYILGLKCYLIILFKVINDIDIKKYCS